MFVQITFLRKLVLAAIYRTVIGSLLGVRSQVVEKIVPLFEAFFALFELTKEDLAPTLGVGSQISHIFISFQAR